MITHNDMNERKWKDFWIVCLYRASLTFWQSVGHITSDPLVNWYSFSDLPQQHTPPFFLCHFLSPSLSPYVPHVLKMCHTSVSGLSETFMSSFRYRGWQGIPLPLVTGHSVTSDGRAFRFPWWRDIPLPTVTGLGIIRPRAGEQSCCGMYRKETRARHGWLSVCVCVR